MKDRVTLVALTLATLALLLALEGPGPRTQAPRAGEEVPDFSFELAGQRQRLRELRGRVVVLNFWATWCPPCVAEMPSLERLHRRLGGRGVVVLGISVDESPRNYEAFLRTHGITFPNYRDPEKRISTLYGTFLFPETFVIDRQGRLVRKFIGAREWDEPEMVDFFTRVLESPTS
ncbi:MAG: TlpA family protein disulfide reductase [Acidobacteria bacterium]|nr:TlpA family protein disulfide reductase [Acidobacteriota bacterium]